MPGANTVTRSPDTVVLSFTISGRHIQYNECIQEANRRINIFRSDFEHLKSDKKSLKTTYFTVNSEYTTKPKTNDRIFAGYVCTHNARLELPFDKKGLNDIIDTLSISLCMAEMRFSFDVKDKEGLEKATLEQAVLMAKANAEILARTAGVRLGPIQAIEYGWSEVRIYEPPALDTRICESEMADIEPQDIGSSDSVTITWEISDN